MEIVQILSYLHPKQFFSCVHFIARVHLSIHSNSGMHKYKKKYFVIVWYYKTGGTLCVCVWPQGWKWNLVKWIGAKIKTLLSELIFGLHWSLLNWVLTDRIGTENLLKLHILNVKLKNVCFLDKIGAVWLDMHAQYSKHWTSDPWNSHQWSLNLKNLIACLDISVYGL